MYSRTKTITVYLKIAQCLFLLLVALIYRDLNCGQVNFGKAVQQFAKIF